MTIAVIGALGKMGKEIIKLAKMHNHHVVAIDKNTDTNNINCDVAIDFSAPQALDTTISICTKNNCPLVCGVTGYSQHQLNKLDKLRQTVKVAHKSNFSTGMQTVINICDNLYDALPNWQYNITEQHHQSKVDTPSGSAITIAKSLLPATVEIHSIRTGDTVGIHSITATNPYEQITITHTVNSRLSFALGAIECAEKLIL